jgi:hypothetical protein
VGANLVWGKGFRIEDYKSPLGIVQPWVVGIDGGFDILSWTSVAEMQSLAEQYGVDRFDWPVYSECTDDMEVPLDEAQELSNELRVALMHVDPRVIEGSYWLCIIHRRLQEGNVFFIMN